MTLRDDIEQWRSKIAQLLEAMDEVRACADRLSECPASELGWKFSTLLEMCEERLSEVERVREELGEIQSRWGFGAMRNQSFLASIIHPTIKLANTAINDLSIQDAIAKSETFLTTAINSVVTQSFSNNVPSPRFSNQSPGTLDDELRSADELGIRPIKVGEAGFDDIINEGTVKWAVTKNLELLVIPKFLDVSNEIYHTVITRGQPVLAAGEAEIVGSNSLYILLTISNHSGHFRPTSESLELGITAFRQQGVDTNNADIEYVE